MRIIIDGYNFLNTAYQGLSMAGIETRDILIGDLAKYKRAKGGDITVVFDNREGFSMNGNKFRDKGINIIFTQRGKTADDEICDILVSGGSGVIVVTSDRTLQKRVDGTGAVCFSSEFFAERCQKAAIEELKGGREDEGIYRSKLKKGPSHKKSKRERKLDRMRPKL